MNIRTISTSMMILAGIGFVGIHSASANIDPTSTTPMVTLEPTGDYLYTYGVEVTNAETVVTGDFFTFYDVNGLVAGSETPASALWTASERATGPVDQLNGSGTAAPATDSAAITNVTFTYTGAASIVGPQSLGNFSFVSTNPVGTTVSAEFAGVANETSGGGDANTANIVGPSATPAGTPEPSAIAPFALGGLGLLGLALRARKARRVAA